MAALEKSFDDLAALEGIDLAVAGVGIVALHIDCARQRATLTPL
jgi:hypothetical protein